MLRLALGEDACDIAYATDSVCDSLGGSCSVPREHHDLDPSSSEVGNGIAGGRADGV